MDLFYLSKSQIDLNSGRVLVDGNEFHHLVRVLRKRKGDRIPVTDGAGLAAELRIDVVGKQSLEGTVLAYVRHQRKDTSITVAISLLKSPQRFDFFLEKATELGVDRIIPMSTRRTVSTPSADRIDRKLDRWREVLLAAARQSRRYFVPEISEPVAFDETLRLEGYDLRFIAHETKLSPPASPFSCKKILFLVGGEGGFTDDEVSAAATAGFRPVSLGRSVLRAETAGIFAVALVRALLFGEAEGSELI